LIKDKDFEIQILTGEKDALSKELEVTASICKSCFFALSDIRHILLSSSSKGCTDKSLTNSFHQWLNTCESLFNSAFALMNSKKLIIK